jgi:hypothetical protein
VSCRPVQRIAYNVNIPEIIEIEDINLSISIQTFEDIRYQSEINYIHLNSRAWEVRINGERSCINSEVLYRTPVAEQMTAVFAHHLARRVPQLTVFINERENADYRLEARVRYFHGIQRFSVGAAVGAQFGLIGALATANATSEGTIIIELTDIKVFDSQNNLVVEIGDFRKKYEGEFPVSANCLCIYQNVNQKLMNFNDELIGLLLLEIRNRE